MDRGVLICQLIVIVVEGILGGFVLIKRPKHQAGRLVALLCFLTCGWIAAEIGTDYFEAAKDPEKAFFLRNLSKCFTTPLAATFVCFAWYFPQKALTIRRKHLVFIYLIGLVFMVGAFTPYDARDPFIGDDRKLHHERGLLHYLYSGYFVLCELYALGYLLYKYQKSTASIARIQIQYVTLGLGLSFLIGTIFSLILPTFFEVSRYVFIATLAPAIGCFFMAYAIVKYRAMEIETAIHWTLTWLVMSSLVLLPIYGTLRLIREWLSRLTHWQLAFIVTGLFFLFFAYFRKIQPLIDRLFRRDYYMMRMKIDQLIENARQLKGLPALAHRIIRTTQRVLHVPHVTLLVYRELEQVYVLIDENSEQRSALTADDLFVRWLAKHNAIVEREQVELQPQEDSIREVARAYFQQMSAEVCVPFVDEGQVIGTLNLGRRARKRWSFTTREIEMLTRLRAAVTLALENSLLHEAQLAQQEKHVQAELIATASSALAHSIKNPLGILDGDLEVLRDAIVPLENEEANFAVSDIQAQIYRIERTVNHIRSATIGPPDLAPCDLNFVVVEALAEVKRANPDSSISVSFPSETIPEILGDTNQLRLAFGNLINNAYQAMHSEGTLTIHVRETTHQNQKAIRIEIQDTGSGMPADLIRQITTRPFITRKKTGTGLGVWTAKKIIEAHGGVLALHSQEGVGTTAIVILPVSTLSH